MSLRTCWMLILALCLTGCSDADPPRPTAEDTPIREPQSASTDSETTASSETEPARNNDAPIEFRPLSLTPDGTAAAAPSDAQESEDSGSGDIDDVMNQLKPLQVMLGTWRGTTRQDYDGFKAVDAHEWVWDLQTNPQQPALVLKSDLSPYLRSARLTWDVQAEHFVMTGIDADGMERKFEGSYTDPVHEVIGPDEKMHRVFRLEFNQTSDERTSDGELWQLAFAQQENNRYLLEVARRRGKTAFRRFDTVSTQREGTSFAVSDSDFGEKTCIISQGLGTIAVSYQGRTYWVCCSGCKAAFEEDPATWIARAAKRSTQE